MLSEKIANEITAEIYEEVKDFVQGFLIFHGAPVE